MVDAAGLVLQERRTGVVSVLGLCPDDVACSDPARR